MAQHIRITLSKKLESTLNELIKRKTIEICIVLRINIILMSAKKLSYEQIKKELVTSNGTISHWKQRWHNNNDKLLTFIAGISGEKVSDNEIKKEILTILGDAPRSGKPKIFTKEIQDKIMAVACESPEKYGLPYSHWTNEELAKQVINMKITDTISACHLGRLLKKRVGTS